MSLVKQDILTILVSDNITCSWRGIDEITDCISKISDIFDIPDGLEYVSVSITLFDDLTWHPDNLKCFTRIDRLSITTRTYREHSIYNEELLDYLPPITHFYIDSVNTTRIPNVFSCYLKYLTIRNCDLRTCSFPVDHCLEELTLSMCELVCIKSIENLKNLHTVYLSINDIDDISPLAGVNYRVLCLDHNKIKDISPLKTCPNLDILWAYDNPLTNGESLIGNIKSLYYDGYDNGYDFEGN